MQQVRAMRIDNTFRVTCGTRCVTHAGSGILIKTHPLKIAINLIDIVFISDGIFERCLRHMRGVGKNHIALD